MDSLKRYYIDELRTLLDQWQDLLINQNATERDRRRISDKIKIVCDQLDEYEKKENA